MLAYQEDSVVDRHLSIHQTKSLKGWFHKQRKKHLTVSIYLSKFSPQKKKKHPESSPLRYEQDHSNPQCLKHLPSPASMEPRVTLCLFGLFLGDPKHQKNNVDFGIATSTTNKEDPFGTAKRIEGLLAASVDCAFDWLDVAPNKNATHDSKQLLQN